jgi:hypothetical protein
MGLSQQEIVALKKEGYTDEQINEQLMKEQFAEMELAKENMNQQNNPISNASQSSFMGSEQENLIKWQLELDSILERIEHILRGDKIKFENGNIYWIPSEDSKKERLNDDGVSEVMRILSMYLNRNTILSNYDEDTINYKVFDFGTELADLLFLKYDEFGWDTLEKRKEYAMIVREVVDIVHSAYLRALHGMERDSLREARSIHQTQPIGGETNFNIGGSMVPRERGVLNPARYIFGKHK